jgi:hypothetical protein
LTTNSQDPHLGLMAFRQVNATCALDHAYFLRTKKSTVLNQNPRSYAFPQDEALHNSTDQFSKRNETEKKKGERKISTYYQLEAAGRPTGEGHGEEEDDEVEEDDHELHLEHGEEELHHEHQQQRVEGDRYGNLQGLHRRRSLSTPCTGDWTNQTAIKTLWNEKEGW